MKTIFTFTLLLFGINGFCQAPGIEWQNTIGGDNSEVLWSSDLTSDGGYIIGGYSLSGISGDKSESLMGYSDFWVIKLNAVGEILWQNSIGGLGDDNL